uniref:Uncharacterized protein n=1 Tax=Percolomonas cosmopolitus TaxID=63605 RepID=A0A7S1PGH3_9EUKA|mmetsp:Transcript_5930/g.22506  ORF Transcript_5930/g.22506 Transcript_5930/m.22506 type:complete len:470 (+) Transcript_5930:130-1539(+)
MYCHKSRTFVVDWNTVRSSMRHSSVVAHHNWNATSTVFNEDFVWAGAGIGPLGGDGDASVVRCSHQEEDLAHRPMFSMEGNDDNDATNFDLALDHGMDAHQHRPPHHDVPAHQEQPPHASHDQREHHSTISISSSSPEPAQNRAGTTTLPQHSTHPNLLTPHRLWCTHQLNSSIFTSHDSIPNVTVHQKHRREKKHEYVDQNIYSSIRYETYVTLQFANSSISSMSNLQYTHDINVRLIAKEIHTNGSVHSIADSSKFDGVNHSLLKKHPKTRKFKDALFTNQLAVHFDSSLSHYFTKKDYLIEMEIYAERHSRVDPSTAAVPNGFDDRVSLMVLRSPVVRVFARKANKKRSNRRKDRSSQQLRTTTRASSPPSDKLAYITVDNEQNSISSKSPRSDVSSPDKKRKRQHNCRSSTGQTPPLKQRRVLVSRTVERFERELDALLQLEYATKNPTDALHRVIVKLFSDRQE